MAQYIRGGYQSPDIILLDLGTSPPTAVPHGGTPGNPASTELQGDADYGFVATIHNDNDFEVPVAVHFWGIHGGIGAAQAHIDCADGTLAPQSTRVFRSPQPFRSAPAGSHRCAVVSLEHGECGRTPDFNDLVVLEAGQKSQAAYRNTNSVVAESNEFVIDLEGNWIGEVKEGPQVRIVIDTLHVPADWPTDEEVAVQIATLVHETEPAGPEDYPFYFLPWLQTGLETGVISDVHVIGGESVEVEEGEVEDNGVLKPAWFLTPFDGPPFVAPFQVAGTLPGIDSGDLVLVNVKARYGETHATPERQVEFAQMFMQP